MTITERLKAIQEKHEKDMNNPRIDPNDKMYHEGMILLVKEKSNWHLYYEPKSNIVFSIAVVPGAKSSVFGKLSYFKKWYRYKKYMNHDIDPFLTRKAFELLENNR